ncbi:MAG TPA: hypothetical protein DCR15_04635, partial [Arthrobacter bacterium]|nr:hypothetical protein [Arthrobacter sp.]
GGGTTGGGAGSMVLVGIWGDGDGVLVAGTVVTVDGPGAGVAGWPPKQAPSNRVVPSAAAANTGRGFFIVPSWKAQHGTSGLYLNTIPVACRFNAGLDTSPASGAQV